jgi:hypothetical protein
MKHVESMPEELIECKACHEKKSKEEHFTKKANQVTCNECLAKAKRRRAPTTFDRIMALERENEELKQKIEKELQEKRQYQDKFKYFSDKYEDLCNDVGEKVGVHKK